MKWFWLWVMKFAYRRVATWTKEPPGIPFRRDPEYPCDGYEPRQSKLNDWGNCQTDGHYLCFKCCHREDPEAAELHRWLGDDAHVAH